MGGNLAGPFPSVKDALEAARAQFETRGFRILGSSRWWTSAAWPDPADPPFLNGVVLACTDLSPPAALQALHDLEADFGRRRDQANAPRTLDLDLIALGRTVIEGPGLILPHPRAHERLFVMGPLAEIAPDWRHPVTGETAKRLAKMAHVGQDAAPQRPQRP